MTTEVQNEADYKHDAVALVLDRQNHEYQCDGGPVTHHIQSSAKSRTLVEKARCMAVDRIQSHR